MPNSLNFFLNGGIFMLPLLITFFLCLAAIFFKFFTLRKSRVVPTQLLHQLQSLDSSQTWPTPILQTLEKQSSTLARLALTLHQNREKSHATSTTILESHAKREIHHLHAGMALLDVLMTIAPLLGLLGTVSGLVVAFQGLSDQSNMITIAAGIAEALHTTIFGISIAVIATIAHSFFSRKIETFCMQLETTLEALQNNSIA